MTIKIEQKIVDYEVVTDDAPSEPEVVAVPVKEEDKVVHLHEKLERPEMLLGSTYKVKTPLTEHALYITINDVILNRGTPLSSIPRTWTISSGSWR